MGFFHAKIYGSGFGEVITNVAELPSRDTGEIIDLNGKYAILWISLSDNEILKLICYLQTELGKSVDEDDFENKMELVFYNGSPVDSYFNLKKFMNACAQIQIRPKMFYYRYRHITTFN